MFDIGSAVATLKADITHFKKGLEDAEGKMKATNSKLGSIAGNMAESFVGFAKKGALALGAAGAAATAFGVKSAADFEQTRIAIETMVGSADNAKKLLKELSVFAAKTPFEFPEIAQTTKQLLAFGFSQEEVLKQMKMIGNFSAGLGVPMGQLAFTFGQVRVAGKLMGQDLNQFINAGVPIIDLLAKTLDKPRESIKKLVEEGQISFKDVEKAMHSLAGEGGKWSDLMDKQSRSLQGRWSTLKDTVGELARAMVGLTQDGEIVKGSFFDKLTTAAQVLIDWLAKNKDSIMAVASTITGSMSQAGGFLVGLFGQISNALQIAWNWFQNHILPVLNVIGGVIVTVFGPALMELWNVIKNKLWPALKELWEVLGPILTPVLKAIGLVIGAGLIVALLALAQALKLAIQLFTKIVEAISWVIKKVAELIKAFESAFHIKDIVSGIASGIISGFREAFDWVKKNVGGVKEALQNLNPFHRNSPSLVDLAKSGTSIITRQYERMFDSINDMAGSLAHGSLLAPVTATAGSAAPASPSQTIINQYNTFTRDTDSLAAAREIGFEIGRR